MRFGVSFISSLQVHVVSRFFMLDNWRARIPHQGDRVLGGSSQALDTWLIPMVTVVSLQDLDLFPFQMAKFMAEILMEVALTTY